MTLCGTILLFAVCFFIDPPTTQIYTLSLHDALPIFASGILSNHESRRRSGAFLTRKVVDHVRRLRSLGAQRRSQAPPLVDRKSTRLNSSHANISYAVFCLKKKKNKTTEKASQRYMNY